MAEGKLYWAAAKITATFALPTGVSVGALYAYAFGGFATFMDGSIFKAIALGLAVTYFSLVGFVLPYGAGFGVWAGLTGFLVFPAGAQFGLQGSAPIFTVNYIIIGIAIAAVALITIGIIVDALKWSLGLGLIFFAGAFALLATLWPSLGLPEQFAVVYGSILCGIASVASSLEWWSTPSPGAPYDVFVHHTATPRRGRR